MKNNNLEKKKCLIYIRVSSYDQIEGTSLNMQDRLCREYANKRGFEVLRLFREEGESAKTANRTKLIEMMAYASKHYKEIGALIIYKIDRLAREAEDYANIRRHFKNLGIQIYSVSENIDDTPMGRLSETMLAGWAQFDNEMRGERCSSGMKEAINEGRYVWNAPVGYKNGKVFGKPNLEVVEEKAKYVREIFELIATDKYSRVEVREIITKKGFRLNNGKVVSKQYFSDMLRNKVYCGIIDKMGIVKKGVFEPIISEELFFKVQSIIKRNGKRKYNKSNPDFPLKDIAYDDKGYKYSASDTTLVSQFAAPFYSTLAFGLEYKPFDWISVNFAPLTGGVVVVTRPELRTKYGNKEDQKVRKEFGTQLKVNLAKEIVKNVKLTTDLTLFSDYLNDPQNIKVNWDLSLSMQVNKLLSANIRTNLIYDDKIKIADQDGNAAPRVQFQEVLSIGLSYTISNK